MTIQELLYRAGLLGAAFLAGSIPFGLVLVRLLAATDIREHGSGNIGATNVRRILGTPAGLATLALDMLKGAIPVWLAIETAGMNSTPGRWYVGVVVLAAVFGHLYPVYLGLRPSGKGVATAAGCFVVISPMAVFVSLLVYVLVVCLFSRGSVASLSATAILPLAIWKTTGFPEPVAVAVIIGVFIFIRHRDNLLRLIRGAEPKL